MSLPQGLPPPDVSKMGPPPAPPASVEAKGVRAASGNISETSSSVVKSIMKQIDSLYTSAKQSLRGRGSVDTTNLPKFEVDHDVYKNFSSIVQGKPLPKPPTAPAPKMDIPKDAKQLIQRMDSILSGEKVSDVEKQALVAEAMSQKLPSMPKQSDYATQEEWKSARDQREELQGNIEFLKETYAPALNDQLPLDLQVNEDNLESLKQPTVETPKTDAKVETLSTGILGRIKRGRGSSELEATKAADISADSPNPKRRRLSSLIEKTKELRTSLFSPDSKQVAVMKQELSEAVRQAKTEEPPTLGLEKFTTDFTPEKLAHNALCESLQTAYDFSKQSLSMAELGLFLSERPELSNKEKIALMSGLKENLQGANQLAARSKAAENLIKNESDPKAAALTVAKHQLEGHTESIAASFKEGIQTITAKNDILGKYGKVNFSPTGSVADYPELHETIQSGALNHILPGQQESGAALLKGAMSPIFQRSMRIQMPLEEAAKQLGIQSDMRAFTAPLTADLQRI